jgi:hypothetical protein
LEFAADFALGAQHVSSIGSERNQRLRSGSAWSPAARC